MFFNFCHLWEIRQKRVLTINKRQRIRKQFNRINNEKRRSKKKRKRINFSTIYNYDEKYLTNKIFVQIFDEYHVNFFNVIRFDDETLKQIHLNGDQLISELIDWFEFFRRYELNGQVNFNNLNVNHAVSTKSKKLNKLIELSNKALASRSIRMIENI